jgi:hypothetical protein
MSNKNEFRLVQVSRRRYLLLEKGVVPQCHVCNKPAGRGPEDTDACGLINGKLVPLCKACAHATLRHPLDGRPA